MNKLLKLISVFSIAFLMLISFASCSGTSFYKTFKALGADITEDNCFTEISLDEFKTKKANNEDFVVLLISSDSTTSANNVSIIQNEYDNQGISGVNVLVFDVKEGVKSVSKGEEMRTTFGVKEISSSLGFVSLGIRDGKLLFDTSNPNDYCDIFKTTSSEINIHAVAQYIFEDVISNN